MTIRVSFELDESDLRHFRTLMQQARESGRSRTRKEVLDAARALAEDVQRSSVPEFVRERVDLLNSLIVMVEDAQWGLGEEDSARVISALVYFSESEDLVADHVPVLGFLDDAIMIELVARELRHELEAYKDFCAFRADAAGAADGAGESVTREEWLAAKRKELQGRMRRRRIRDAARRGWRSLLGRPARQAR